MGIFQLSSVCSSVTILCILASLCLIQCENLISTENSTIRNPESRIIGGEDATEGEFPHAVYVIFSDDSGFCGGSILSADYILLAAHCVDKSDPTKIFIGVGKHDIRDLMSNEFYPVAEVIIHPCWDQLHRDKHGYGLNDIAIVKLGKTLPLNGRNIKTIKIDNEKNLAVDGTVIQAIGWGRTRPTEPESRSAKLKKAFLADITKDCSELFLPRLKPEGQICSFNKTASTCFGDSGGSLLCDDRTGTNTPVLCGIVSLGRPGSNAEPCTGLNIFTRVYHYRNWIEAVVLSGKKFSALGCLGGELFIINPDPRSKNETQGTSRGCLSYRPNHFICAICLILIFISFWGKKIFLNF